jgi:2-iminobutanoate/2-iminopropanoate deaminase
LEERSKGEKISDKRKTMKKQIVTTPSAPTAIGPYSQAVRVGELIFLSGQIPLDPETGQMVSGDIAIQARRVMENLAAVLRAGDAKFADVVRSTIYLTNLQDFAKVNEVYGSYFSADPPARATVEVAALPRGAGVEIDMIAHVGGE